MKQILWLCALLTATVTYADTVFVEAEMFTVPDDGWVVRDGIFPHLTSGKVLGGAGGALESVATHSVTIAKGGQHRIWVRYFLHDSWRGPFRLTVASGNEEIGSEVFDRETITGVGRGAFQIGWTSFLADLPVGTVTLRLSKEDPKACSGWTRRVDCLLITDDLTEDTPNHVDYGPQVWLRATLGDSYDEPVQVHLYIPFVGHYHLSRAGLGSGTGPKPDMRLESGESTDWCNITKLLLPRLAVGARPIINTRTDYQHATPRLHARFEFATAASDDAIVRRLDVDYQPGTLYLGIPTDLSSPEQLARFTVDRELAERIGALADAMDWPTFGHPPQVYPFFSGATMRATGQFAADAKVVVREQKTLDYYGFSDQRLTFIHGGSWWMKDHSQWLPDEPTMRKRVVQIKAELDGHVDWDKVVFCKLMDEPGPPKTQQLVEQPSAQKPFQDWLREQDLNPHDLGVTDWDEVLPVGEDDRDAHPQLHYYTQRFRTVVLSRFMALQRRVIRETYGRDFRSVGNFSDVPIYTGNLLSRGDYFEFMDAADQNALWSECGGAYATTPQCTNYNVDLMRGAARGRDVQLGHYLMVYGRKPWDFQAKAVGHAARDVKVLVNYYYGPTWGNYEGGPPWRSSAWYAHPDMWKPNAELVRLFGGAEQLLVLAKRARAKVAILYPQSADIWTLNRNHAYGYDRMHLWLALTHAQVPVDIIDERQVAAGALDDYSVCYLSGPNLLRSAADKLATWVRHGGTLVLTAGAAERDEFDRPLATVSELAPADRGTLRESHPFLNYGQALRLVPEADTISAAEARLAVLSVRETLTEKTGVQVLGIFADGTPAIVWGKVDAGAVWQFGCLPGLSYIYPAVKARFAIDQTLKNLTMPATVDDLPTSGEALPTAPPQAQVSIAPWEFPSHVRDLLVRPVGEAKVELPIHCSMPLVDAGYMVADAGIVIPLVNWTLQPIDTLTLDIAVDHPVAKVESVRHGQLSPTTQSNGRIRVALPLGSADFVMLHYRALVE